MIADFHFLRPLWFLALLPLLGLIWYMLKRGLDNQQWRQVCDPELLPHILVGQQDKSGYVKELIIGVIGSAIIVALAGPTWERLPQPVYKNESALVIVLDLSLSMYADDIQPSRLERARFEISDLLDVRKEGQTAMVVYAGDAFTVTPLTDDIKTIRSQLTALSPEIMPAQGSDTKKALTLSVDLMQQAGHRDGDILLITDEIEARYEDSLQKAQQLGYRVSILGIGTAEGAPIKLKDGGYLKAPDGNIVIPVLDVASLKKLADKGGGVFQTSRIDNNDTNAFESLFARQLQANGESESDLRSDSWYELGPWLLLPLLPVLALGFRRGVLCSFGVALVTHQDPAMALDWNSLWLNDNQRAYDALQKEQPAEAAALFNDPQWRAAANYRAGNFAETDKLLQQSNDIPDMYNRANALARQGRYEEAIALYDAVLEKQPQHEDATFNRDLLKQQQEQQQQQQSSSQQNNEQQSGEEQQQQQQQQQSSEQAQNEQQQEQDSQNSDEQQTEENEQQTAEQQQAQQQESEQSEDNEQQASSELEQQLDEQQQASEQWLRRIPDDPAGLLRRKFKYQYQQSERQNNTTKYW